MGSTNRTIAFIGPMASGKSAVGEAYAGTMNLSFADTDRLVVARHGSVESIFASRGEQYFRILEARTVAEVLSDDSSQVVSLGGGAVLDTGTQQLLRAAYVVFLCVDADTIAPRLLRGAARPLLRTGAERGTTAEGGQADLLARWEELYRARFPVYRRLADVVLDARGKSVAAIVAELQCHVPEGFVLQRRCHEREM